MRATEWPFDKVPESGFQALGPHVTAYYAQGHPYSNCAIVAGADGMLVFDADIFHYARVLADEVERVRQGRPLQLVISHAHADHTDGAMYFVPPAQSVATSWTRRRVAWWSRQPGEALAARNREYGDFYPGIEAWYRDFRFVVPDRSVDREEIVDLGGVSVRLVPVEVAHTPGDLWALVEPDGVVLCGDLWFNDCEPYLRSGSIPGSLRVLDQLRRVGARSYLPGHGVAGAIKAGGKDAMERYCRWVRDRVGAGMQAGLTGQGLAEAVRREFQRQWEEPEGIRFAHTWRTFLEEAVEAEEAAVRGDPVYDRIELAEPAEPAETSGSARPEVHSRS